MGTPYRLFLFIVFYLISYLFIWLFVDTTTNEVVSRISMSYNILEDKLCVSKHPRMVITVPSSINNTLQRQLIRETWGNPVLLKENHIVLVFLIGRDRTAISANLISESQHYEDIIQGDVPDDYDSLSYKTLMGIHWATHYCSSAGHILKVDDDILLNPIGVLNVIGKLNSRPFLCGRIIRHANARRIGKWALGTSVYVKQRLPFYIAGNAYAMPMKVAKKLYNASKYVPMFPLEDVYLTGMVAKKAKVTLRHTPELPEWSTVLTDKNLGKFERGELVGIHMVPTNRWRYIYENLNVSHFPSSTIY